MPVQALPLVLLAEAMGMSIPIVTDYYKAKGIDLSGYDANDIVPLEVLLPELAELNRIKKYQTWDESFYQPKPVVGDTDLSDIAVQMSESEARKKGYIIPPEPTVTEEERKKSIIPTNIPVVDEGKEVVETFPAEISDIPTIIPDPVLKPDDQETFPILEPDTGSMILTSQTDKGEITQDEKVPPFYSKVKKVIEDARMDKATTDQWKGYIDNAGVNQAELDWIGLNDYLADKKSVTKEEVLNFVEMNDLAWQVKDIILGTESDAIKFTGDTMEMIEGQGTTLTHDPRVPEILREAHGYQDAKDIVMNEEGLYNQYQEYLQETDQVRGDEIEGLESFLKDELGIVKGSSDQGKTMFNRESLITEGDYTDYKEMIFQLPKNEWLIRDLENQLKVSRDLQKELARTRDWKEWNKDDDKKWHELSDQQNKLQAKIDQIQGSEFKSHYKYPNVFAHARFNTREIDGKKTLFIEELQSDWIHQGKKEGFKNDKEYYKLREEQQKLFEIQSKIAKEIKEQGFDGTAEQQEEYYKAKDRYDEIENILNKSYNNAVPDIPFKKNWQDVVLKRLIRYASENDFDAIALAGGSIQADRYDLSNHIDSISIKKSERADGKIYLQAVTKDQGTVALDHHIYPDQLEEYIGKDLAKKIKNDLPDLDKMKNNTVEGLNYSGLDLKIGGEGLKAMYDEVFSKSLKKIGKKFDAKLIEKVMKSEKFTPDEDVGGVQTQSTLYDPDAEMQRVDEGWYKQKENEFWFMDLTPSMKKQALEMGFAITGLREGGIVEIPHFYYGGFVDINRL